MYFDQLLRCEYLCRWRHGGHHLLVAHDPHGAWSYGRGGEDSDSTNTRGGQPSCAQDDGPCIKQGGIYNNIQQKNDHFRLRKIRWACILVLTLDSLNAAVTQGSVTILDVAF